MWEIISTASVNLVFTLAVIFYSGAKFRNEGYALYKTNFYIKKGLFIKTEKKIGISGIEAVTIHKNAISSFLFDVCRVFVDVPSVRSDRHTSVYLTANKAQRLLGKVLVNDKTDYRYKAKNRYL